MDRRGALSVPETSEAYSSFGISPAESRTCRTNALSAPGLSVPEGQPKAGFIPFPAQTVTLAVENMVCGGCMRKVEQALLAAPGVVSARANLSARRATVVFEDRERPAGAAGLIDALGAVGFRAAELAPESDEAARNDGRGLLSRLAVAGFAAMNIMLFSVSVWAGSEPGDPIHALFFWLSAAIALPTVAYAGQPFFGSAWAALSRGRLNMDVPISLAILLSASMSLYQTIRGGDQVYFDASVTLLFFLLIGRYLDQRVRTRARGAAENPSQPEGAVGPCDRKRRLYRTFAFQAG